MTQLTQSFADKYDERNGIKWGAEVLSTRGICGAKGRWGTPTEVQDAQAEHNLTLLLIELRKKRLP